MLAHLRHCRCAAGADDSSHAGLAPGTARALRPPLQVPNPVPQRSLALYSQL